MTTPTSKPAPGFVHKIPEGDDRQRQVCESCGYVAYENPKVVVGVPLATSSEADRRVDIIRRAVAEVTDGADTSAVVYVGDGTWDVRACRDLGIGFIGRAAGDAAGRLAKHGARAIVPDFVDGRVFLHLLSRPGDLSLSADEV